MDLKSPAIFIGRQGNGIISFGSGQPDLPPPKEVVENIQIRPDLRYGLIQGESELREALSAEYPGSAANDFVITNGASEALDLVFRAIRKGKVLVGKPYYYSYPHIIKHAGMEPIYTELVNGRINLEDFKKKVKNCKAVLINSPSNPTGRVEKVETLKEIERICEENDIYIISDEVYKDLIYERENYLIKGLKVITINSFSKTYAMCGVRIGYLWSRNREIIDKIIEIKTHTSMNTNLIGQDMALRAMQAPKEYIRRQLEIWRKRRDLIYNGLIEIGLELWKPEGAFYVLPKVNNPEALVRLLFEEYKVITYLGDWFGAPGRIRLSYALDEELIKEGLRRIEEGITEIS